MDFTLEMPQGLRGANGNGDLKIADYEPEAPAHEIYTGTATR